MKHRPLVAIAALALVLTGANLVAHAAQPAPAAPTYVPPDGYVPNAKIAVEIAAIVAEPIYGKDVLAHEQPLVARLEGDVWVVTGTLAKGLKGGTLECHISKRTGQILRMIHGV